MFLCREVTRSARKVVELDKQKPFFFLAKLFNPVVTTYDSDRLPPPLQLKANELEFKRKSKYEKKNIF